VGRNEPDTDAEQPAPSGPRVSDDPALRALLAQATGARGESGASIDDGEQVEVRLFGVCRVAPARDVLDDEPDY
jgi:hypothetical protein